MFSRSKKQPAAPAEERVARVQGQSNTKSFPPSILSGSLRITGDLDSTGDIQIDGGVDGDIRSHKVTVGENATVNGSVIAEQIRIAGTVNGEITGREVSLTSTARVMGDIYHDSLSIEAGAHMQGLCRRVEKIDERLKGNGKAGTPKPAVSGQPVSAAAPAPSEEARESEKVSSGTPQTS